jgi:fructose 1,6-bisphosphate aldolase/phosphatase
MGTTLAEMQVDERPSEYFLLIAADQTRAGALNLPLWLAFADQRTPHPAFSGNLSKDFRFAIRDTSSLSEGRVITLDAPEELGKSQVCCAIPIGM